MESLFFQGTNQFITILIGSDPGIQSNQYIILIFLSKISSLFLVLLTSLYFCISLVSLKKSIFFLNYSFFFLFHYPFFHSAYFRISTYIIHIWRLNGNVNLWDFKSFFLYFPLKLSKSFIITLVTGFYLIKYHYSKAANRRYRQHFKKTKIKWFVLR